MHQTIAIGVDHRADQAQHRIAHAEAKEGVSGGLELRAVAVKKHRAAGLTGIAGVALEVQAPGARRRARGERT